MLEVARAQVERPAVGQSAGGVERRLAHLARAVEVLARVAHPDAARAIGHAGALVGHHLVRYLVVARAPRVVGRRIQVARRVVARLAPAAQPGGQTVAVEAIETGRVGLLDAFQHRVLQAVTRVQRESHGRPGRAGPGLDEDRAVRGPRAVQRRGGRAAQDRDGLDVVHVDVHRAAARLTDLRLETALVVRVHVYGDPVDHVQRLAAAREGRLAPDDDTVRRARAAAGGGYLHAGHLALECRRQVHLRHLGEGLLVDVLHRVTQAPLRALDPERRHHQTLHLDGLL